ncbi:PLP-dependent aminotransferase family protein [Rugamonas sp. A1-17]|nr:PLP-dependent aminotransferase family protein [Rugamonas sp. A1-17]
MSKSRAIQDESRAVAWLGRFSQHAGPRYMQIADFVERALADGRLKPGDRLPPQRRLAQLLQVDLTTVTRAYDEARRRNLLVGRGARGTYAAAPRVELTQLLDLSMNIPPPPAGVDFDDLLKQGLAQVLLRTDSGLLMNYHLGGGGQSDRAAGAAWLAPMLGKVDEEQVLVCPGAQPALAALILTLSRPGDTILAEAAVYPGLRTAAAQLGRRVQAVDADAAGMLPDALETACGKRRVALLYLNPTLQNPTAHTMPAARRREIVRVAARCGVQIIEDDPYWLLADAPPPLAHYAPRQVNYISTLSKCLAPGLRTAFVLLSDPQRREDFMAALRSFVLMSTPLTTALATQWIHDGSARRLLAGVREEARTRQRLAHQLLAGREAADGDGIHVWLPLPGYWTAPELARAAQAEGLAVTSSAAFYAGPRPPNAIRISLGSIRDSQRLAAALRKLSQLLARRPPPRQQAPI